ncbi:MAG TPA: hypothetical protein VFG47_04855, partial [Geminicoccaceae bacterium]|nr:hypothetical protein [Geminicoccaceae bacterium]
MANRLTGKTVAHLPGAGRGGVRSEGLELEGEAGKRLERAVVQVAGEAGALLGHGRLLETLLEVELVEVGREL